MGIEQIVTAIITGLFAAACGIYAGFAAKRKGPILTNTYLWASKEERERADKNAEYHLAAVVFGVLSLVWAAETVYVLTKSTIALIAGISLLVFELVYAIVDAVKSGKRAKEKVNKS